MRWYALVCLMALTLPPYAKQALVPWLCGLALLDVSIWMMLMHLNFIFLFQNHQESASQRVIFCFCEQETGQGKKRYFVMSDQDGTPILNLRLLKDVDTVWEAYDCCTDELVFRISPTLHDPNNMMRLQFRNVASDFPASDDLAHDGRDVHEADLLNFPPIFSSNLSSGEDNDQGEVVFCRLFHWKVLYSCDQLFILTRPCARSERLNEVVGTSFPCSSDGHTFRCRIPHYGLMFVGTRATGVF